MNSITATGPAALSHLAARLELALGQHSLAGRKGINEDAIGIRVPGDALLTTKGAAAVIADGVSSAEAGREASQSCVTGFLSDYYSTPETWSVQHSVQQVLTALNRWLYRSGQDMPDARRGYITTLSAVVFKSRRAHLFHVGDSRIYRLRRGDLEQLTRDHVVPVGTGQAYLARALGLDVHLEVDYRALPLEPDDLYLLTTDGVHDHLAIADLKCLLEQNWDTPEACCRALCEAALAAGSPDNLSCQLLRVADLPRPGMDDVMEQLTELRFPPPLDPGDELDGYRIERELHASSRSQAYLVRDPESGARYCMKTPSVNFEDDPAYIERFILESWIGARVQNPHVVRVVESRRPRTALYYLTEYIDGMSLAQWMREHPRPPVDEVVSLVSQVARGVQALHRRETLHQDMKPDNILINSNGHVKLIDFGSCRVAGIAEIDTPLARDLALGTETYTAPEIRLGRRPGPQADQFALAVITFEMLTGELPFGGQLEHCRSQRDFLATRYTPSYGLNPRVPVWMDGALRKALRFHPERRHADVAEFAHELQHPNPAYLEYHQRPLLERNPLRFWQLLAVLLVLTELATLALLID